MFSTEEDVVFRSFAVPSGIIGEQSGAQVLTATRQESKHFDFKAERAVAKQACCIGASSVAAVQPFLVPSVLSNQVVDSKLSIEDTFDKIHCFLKSEPIRADFSPPDFAWNCSKVSGTIRSCFTVKLFRYSTRSEKKGQFLIEMQRIDGDRMMFSETFKSLKSLFCDEAVGMDCEQNQIFEGNVEIAAGLPAIISEERLKQLLLETILDESCGYKPKLEAVQLAGSLFVGSAPITNPLERDIFNALVYLGRASPQFAWLLDCCRSILASKNGVPVESDWKYEQMQVHPPSIRVR